MNREDFTVRSTNHRVHVDNFQSAVLETDFTEEPTIERPIFIYDMYVKWGVQFRAPYARDHPIHYDECESQAWKQVRNHAYSDILGPIYKLREAINSGMQRESLMLIDDLERTIRGK